MQLTIEEEDILAGKRGPVLRKAMEILYRLGEIYGADRMVPVNSVHMPGASTVVAGEAGTRYVEDTAANGGTFAAYTTLNPAATDLDCWQRLGSDDATAAGQRRLTSAYERMGAITCHTCTPYLCGHIPRLGEHIAWGESSAIAFANSMLGARTSREGGPSALASALTGKAPAYGMHLTENRRGQVLVKVRCPLPAVADYGRVGYLVGQVCNERIPVFEGIPANATLDQMKSLGAALASSGSIALFHAVGVTPEAPTTAAAFGGLAPQETMEISQSDLARATVALTKAETEPLSLVAIGCPHASITEIGEIARLLAGRHLHPNMHLWVMTAQPTRALAERMGYTAAIEQAGGEMVCDTCAVLAAMDPIKARYGYQSVVTNSAKLAHYAPGQCGLASYFGDLEQCLRAAVTAIWG